VQAGVWLMVKEMGITAALWAWEGLELLCTWYYTARNAYLFCNYLWTCCLEWL